MARITLDPPSTMTGRLADWYARRTYGKAMDPVRAMAHNAKVLKADARFEMRVANFDEAPDELKHLAVMAAAVTVGCSWCVDFGYWLTVSNGMDARKMTAVPQWRTQDVFTDLERAVLEFAEAASATPIAVTDEMVSRLREDLTEAQVVELAMMVAVENQRSRFNAALGLTSQGFKEACDVPVQR